MMKLRSPLFAILALSLSVGTASTALAQPGAAPNDPAMVEAGKRFSQGTKLYNENEFKLALIEFQRSYELSNNYKVLYNIGQVNLQLNNYAKALTALEAYLAQGGKEVQGKRRKEVEFDIGMLRDRTAHVTVNVNVKGAEVVIDDAEVGTTPINEPLLVDAGKHTIHVTISGRIPASKTITLAGSDKVVVTIELEEPKVAPPPPPIRQVIERPPPPQQPQSNVPWAAWGVTGALGVATIVTGVLYTGAQGRHDDAMKSTTASTPDLESKASTAKALAITTDALLAATIISGGISLYLTLKSPQSHERGNGKSLNVGVGPGRVMLSGTF